MSAAAKRPAARSAGAALLVLTVLAAGCQRPPDEAWLRFLGFARPETTAIVASLDGKLRDGLTDEVDALFENRSSGVSKDAAGTGVLVYRARVDYRMPRFSPPGADHAVTLYIPAAGTGDDAGATATLAGLPLASAALKRWLIDTRAFEDGEETPTVDVTAVVTFFAVTDEGAELQTSGGITISLSNAP